MCCSYPNPIVLRTSQKRCEREQPLSAVRTPAPMATLSEKETRRTVWNAAVTSSAYPPPPLTREALLSPSPGMKLCPSRGEGRSAQCVQLRAFGADGMAAFSSGALPCVLPYFSQVCSAQRALLTRL